ncbi:hypothetical protein [Algicella marina]|uniref:Uncharacterized protein n=1 Tax=Algicella marina TaxID=2683284 RepID=A0A6P1SWP0_9RHOB|nr:hypothetical protein [Algicella marina]QHQ33901.1 hypothetical protein GO499_01240 [Algicella marina]
MAFDSTNPFRNRPRALARLPRLIRFYIFHSAMGFTAAALFTTLILVTDTAGLGHLVSSVHGGWLAAVVFFVLNGIVFAGVQTAIAVMALPDR